MFFSLHSVASFNADGGALVSVNGGVKVYRRGGAKVYQLAHDGLMLF
jgi:hypothetical protein